MKAAFQNLALILFLVWGSGAYAQTTVYETRDAAGNPVFTDEPAVDSEVVDIPATNTADAPAERAMSAAAHEKADQAESAAGPLIRVVGEEQSTERGDGFVEEHTPDGDILVNQRERDTLDKDDVIYEGGRRILIKEPRAGKKER